AVLVGCPVVVATHSADFLGDPAIRLLHVRRTDTRGTELLDMPPVVRQEIDSEALGLRPADLLQLCRAFLAVEAEHDIAVLSTLIGDVLDAAHVRLLAMRGARNAPALADAQLVFDFTDANLVVFLDHITAQTANDSWQQSIARLHHRTSGRNRL